MEKRRVVITGLGTVNPLGNNTADSWACLLYTSSGMVLHISVRTASGRAAVISVAMKPGATALTVTFRLASSLARLLVRPIRPALLAE